MKILQINVFHYIRGGAETVYFNTSRLLREHGHEVINFALKWDENLECEQSQYFPESKQTRKGPLRHIRNAVTYFYHRQAAKNLDRLLKAQKPDLAQIHLIWGQLSPSILRVLKKHKVPAVLTAHDYRIVCPAYLFRNGKGEICEKCEGKKFYNCFTNNCCKGSRVFSAMMALEQYGRNAFFNPGRLASGIIYVSDFCQTKHEQYMPALKNLPSARIYNFSTPVNSTPANSEKYFLFFGRLSKEKGIETLLRAAATIPDVRFKIVGTGPLENSLKKFARNLNLYNVDFTGYKTGRELEKLIAGAYFTIVPSEWYENNPMTIVESYCSSVPVIGARIGGIPEIIREGCTGFTFSPGNADELAAAIRSASALTAAQYEEFRNNAREFAQQNFSAEAYYKNLIKFYNSLISKR